jgi:hypothetical protein
LLVGKRFLPTTRDLVILGLSVVFRKTPRGGDATVKLQPVRSLFYHQSGVLGITDNL